MAHGDREREKLNKRRVRALRWRLAVPFVRLLGLAVSVCSRRQLIALGRAAGRLLSWGARREMDRARTHLETAFPDRPPAWRERTARRAFDHLAIGFFETLAIYRWRREAIDELILGVEQFEAMRQRTAGGTGAVFVTGHIGNWELLAAAYARHGGRMHVVGRRMPEAAFDSFLTTLRGASGVVVLDRDDSPREMLRVLRAGGSIGILPDQDITEVEGIFVNFFGRPAWTPTAPAKLVLASGVPMYVAALVREGERFRLVIDGPIWGQRGRGRRRAEIERLTRAWSDRLETIIWHHPDQWVWMHRRWRNTPERLAFRRAREPSGAALAGGPA